MKASKQREQPVLRPCGGSLLGVSRTLKEAWMARADWMRWRKAEDEVELNKEPDNIQPFGPL